MPSDPRPAATAPSPTAEPAALLVDRREAARLLGVSPGSIDNLRLAGELPSLKLGARRLFDMADLRRLIDTRKRAQRRPEGGAT